MKSLLLLSLSLLLTSAFAQKAETLFNGKNLDGWDGDPRLWSVQDGVIVGIANTADTKLKANSFLIWKGGEVEDFEFSMEAKVTGENNSGIQYRAKVVDPKTWSVGGYQMDMHPKAEFFGMLYEERGRGIAAQRGQKVTLKEGKKPEVTGKVPMNEELKLDQWNTFTVRAQGNVLTHMVNGIVTTIITDEDKTKRSMKGVIALQLHGGNEMKLEAKNIKLTKLKPGAKLPAPKMGKGTAAAPAKPAAPAKNAAAKKAADSKAQWIWPDAQDGTKKAFFRKSFEFTGKKERAILHITADNSFTAYLNGTKVREGTDWGRKYEAGVRGQLKNGTNVIAVECGNSGSVGGLVADLEITADGKTTHVITDKTWKTSKAKMQKGWETVAFKADDSWKTPHVHGVMGIGPWGNVFGGKSQGGDDVGGAKLATKNDTDASALKDFKVERIFDVPKAEMGSWVSMAVDNNGHLICSDQGKQGLWRIDISGEEPVASKIDVDLTGAHGLLWAYDSLYASVNGKSGFFRVVDSDGDSELDKVLTLRSYSGAGEHGPHEAVLGPDGMIYTMGGNATKLPSPESSRVAKGWAEDQLLPRMPDARGHAKNLMAPGGWICRTDKDGTAFELISTGYRNQYGFAFNGDGEMFVYDSDMEWDAGTPWYRPTRICHATQGSEFGWRNGTGKMPSSYPDTLPGVVDIGPGSPTAVISGKGAKFPAKYQKALYAFDWTYGTMYAIHQTPNGASYTCEKEEFVTGVPLNLTDGVIHPDGNMYFAVGGRGTPSGLYKVSYTGKESTAAADLANYEGADFRALRRSLESFQKPDKRAVKRVWPHLGHPDRYLRFAARVALEHQDPTTWQDRALSESDAPTALGALLALTRQGDKELKDNVVAALGKIEWTSLNQDQQHELLRVYSLAFIRMGEPSKEQAAAIAATLDPFYPSADDALNRELCRMLVYLQSPNVAAKTVALMSQDTVGVEEDWGTDLLSRSARYGNSFASTTQSNPQRTQIHYALCLRNLDAGWTEDTRKQYFTWFQRARTFKGGNSFGGYINNIRNEALKRVPEGQRAALDKLSQEPPKTVPDGFADARALPLGCKIGMKFDQDELRAKAGEKLKVVFTNNDPSKIMHNVAFVKPGKADAVMTAALALGNQGMVRNFIPAGDDILSASTLVLPGKASALYFTAPTEPGNYPYICTYPGHGLLMRGVLVVE